MTIDAAIIDAAKRVEPCEIAAYGMAIAYREDAR